MKNITLSNFRNRSRHVRSRVSCIIILVIVYAVASSLIASQRVYTPLNGTKISKNDSILNLVLRRVLLFPTLTTHRRHVTAAVDEAGTLESYIDPFTAVLNTALKAFGISSFLTVSEQEDYVLVGDNDREQYYKNFNDGLPVGVLSQQGTIFFRDIQNKIDRANNDARCLRYGGYYNSTQPANRRIFYGALAANEPWELYEIVAAEVYGLYAGMVFVEGNRTQNFTPRKFERLKHAETMKELFGADAVQVRQFVNEDKKLLELYREHEQRAEIIKGWKELGMQPEDVGLLADSDETFTRDFLKAVQVCDGIEILNYEGHQCHHSKAKITATTLVFESSPECITSDRTWYHPDMIIGHCIEGIARNGKHNPAPRTDENYAFLRAEGYGQECQNWTLEENLPNKSYSLWNAADFRRLCGGYMVNVRPKYRTFDDGSTLDQFTGYHFHNFFSQFKSTRFKYMTYGHADPQANTKTIQEMSNDLKMMYKCVTGQEDSADQKWKHSAGGFNTLKPFVPIYFQDLDYRDRRHQYVLEMVREDEQLLHEKLMQQQLEKELSSGEHAAVDNQSKRTLTETGIDIADPALYLGEDANGDSTTATVIALATGYDLRTYQRFVGSLRKSGYKGHIILGLHPDVENTILEYMKFRKVTVKLLSWTNCTYTKSPSAKKDIFKETKCADPYPDIKIRWSRFPLARDWLKECTTCTGPVLIMDARDSFFQADPFGPGSPPIKGLQVFQEHVNMTTSNWLTQWPIKDCKGIEFKLKPMLCSGTTVGTRAAMLKYLEIIYAEMKVWIEDPKCRFDINGDDQSIHNYLFYSGQLPFATSIVNRKGGIVNTIGHHAAQVAKKHFAHLKQTRNLEGHAARLVPYEGANEKTWIGPEFGLTNDRGLFVEFDGSISRVIHQFDRFDQPLFKWLNDQDFIRDEIEFQKYRKQSGMVDNSDVVKGKSAQVPQSESGNKLSTSTKRRKQTDTGIDLTDPELYETVDVNGDSTTATVMALASGYDLPTYERFVGTLRKSGFKGHIFLGVSPDVGQEILRYFDYRSVTPKILKWVNCTYAKGPEDKDDIFQKTTCSHPYPDIKIRWSRFPLARDWLRDCATCTGPVLIMDARDSLFQLDPFGPGSPPITGLQVFQEHVNMTTKNWLTNWPIGACKGVFYDEPMLCSGTTVGTRAAMLKYLEIMYAEMKVWIEDPKCRFPINGDDQSIHNYLYYSGQLPFAESIVNRMGGIVNTIGHHAAQIAKWHFAKLEKEENLPKWEASRRPYEGASDRTWIGTHFGVTNDVGQFTEFDGSLSRVVHQWDRFHRMFESWLNEQSFVHDRVPATWKSSSRA